MNEAVQPKSPQFTLNFYDQTKCNLVRKGNLNHPVKIITANYRNDVENFYEIQVGSPWRRMNRRRLPDFVLDPDTNKILCEESSGSERFFFAFIEYYT